MLKETQAIVNGCQTVQLTNELVIIRAMSLDDVQRAAEEIRAAVSGNSALGRWIQKRWSTEGGQKAPDIVPVDMVGELLPLILRLPGLIGPMCSVQGPPEEPPIAKDAAWFLALPIGDAFKLATALIDVSQLEETLTSFFGLADRVKAVVAGLKA